MRRIGVMGGTFNPIHAGHLLLAEWALTEVGLDEVWFIPTGVSYMKNAKDIAAGEDRLRMTQLAVEDNSSFKCLDIEVRREGYTYSCETLEYLRQEYPEDSFFFLVGADCLFSIESWKDPERIFHNCTLVAAVRGETTLPEMEEKRRELEHKYQGACGTDGCRILLLPFISMSVSSTEIRRRIYDRKSVRYLVPDKVMTYIKEKGLYSEKSNRFEKAQESNGKSSGDKEI